MPKLTAARPAVVNRCGTGREPVRIHPPESDVSVLSKPIRPRTGEIAD